MSANVLVPVADGTEELEAVAIIDTLRRAGVSVVVAAVGGTLEVTCSRGVKLMADTRIADLKASRFDLIALPGGMPGAQHLHDSPDLTALLRAQVAAGGWLAAICAAPVVVLARHGLLGARRATAHASVIAEVPVARRCVDPVVVDDGLVTGRGAGTALAFALVLVEQLCGRERRREVARAMGV